jgi:hypothetical protein
MINRVLGGFLATSLSLLAFAQGVPAHASDNHAGEQASATDLGGYFPVGPERILDTRHGTGGFRRPVGPHSSIALRVVGRNGVPAAGVTAVVVDVTAVKGTRASYVTVYPDGLARPADPSLEFAARRVVTKLVTVPVGPDGRVRFYNHAGQVNVVADLAGYYSSWPGGSLLNPVRASRMLDTRDGTGVRKGKVGPGKSITVQVTGKDGVPAAGVSAVALKVTAVNATGASYLTVWPGRTRRPVAWNLTFTTGGRSSDAVIVPVSATGTVSLYNHAGRVNLIADLTGYYTSAVGRTDVLSGGSYGFSEPSGMAFDGAHMWITNGAGSVTEVNTSDGSLVRTLSGGHYGFDIPWGITFDGTHLWIANYSLTPGGGSVTEVNASDGSWIRTLSGSSYAFNQPDAIASDGTHVWIANEFGNSVTEVNASDGSLVRVLSGGSYSIDSPHSFAFDGTHMWITNNNDTVTEVNASDGSLVRTLSPGAGVFNAPMAIAFGSGHLWIANYPGTSGIGYAPVNAVTELNAADGTVVRTISGGFFTPLGGLAFDGTHLWISDYGHNSVIVAQG